MYYLNLNIDKKMYKIFIFKIFISIHEHTEKSHNFELGLIEKPKSHLKKE